MRIDFMINQIIYEIEAANLKAYKTHLYIWNSKEFFSIAWQYKLIIIKYIYKKGDIHV
mgnify:CR=1 FL=1